jgi:hypothetical protein
MFQVPNDHYFPEDGTCEGEGEGGRGGVEYSIGGMGRHLAL